ncbi:MAG TPA: macro domain-containing protein [Nitrososphaeraceae archaeon]|nr:macro domain-containing protein [Nitrososphaeraceae archaeon]
MSIIAEINLNNNNKIIRLVKGDITEREVDAIVNPANSYLRHGGGVAAAIVRKGGVIIQQESNKIGFVPVGFAAITTAGKLPCKAIIHAVGPRMGEGDEDNKLRKVVRSSLILASEKGYVSISMPAISSGIFGFPKDRCARILINEVKRYLEDDSNTTFIETVEFCIIDNETVDYFEKEFANMKKYLIK